MTQKSLSQDTSYIEKEFPKLWRYLESHSTYFDRRKSRIYRRRPRFSIFGVGGYAFKPYKVAICGLYKEPVFSLLRPIGGKPVIVDDTSYYLSFDTASEAVIACTLLNTYRVREFLSTLVFTDSKRIFTKEILMRIDLLKLAELMTFQEVLTSYKGKLRALAEFELDEKDYSRFKSLQRSLTPEE